MNPSAPPPSPPPPYGYAPVPPPVYQPAIPAGPTLEHLVNTNQLIGQQKLNWFGITRNDFNVINHANVLAFQAKYLHYRLAYGLESLFQSSITKLEVAILDLTTGREILHIQWKLNQGCIFTDYRGALLGYLDFESHFLSASYINVMSAQGVRQFSLQRHVFSNKYDILTADRTGKMGTIEESGGLFSGMNQLSVNFPLTLPVEMKLMLFGCTFVVEYIRAKRHHDSQRRV